MVCLRRTLYTTQQFGSKSLSDAAEAVIGCSISQSPASYQVSTLPFSQANVRVITTTNTVRSSSLHALAALRPHPRLTQLSPGLLTGTLPVRVLRHSYVPGLFTGPRGCFVLSDLEPPGQLLSTL